jgi:hypothetical protein
MSRDAAGYGGMGVCLVRMSAKSGLKKQQQAASKKPQAKSKKGAHLSAGPSPAWRDRDFASLCGLRTTIGIVLGSLPLSGISSQWCAAKPLGCHRREPHAAESNRFPITPVYGLVALDGFIFNPVAGGQVSAAQQLSVAWRSRVAGFATHLGPGWTLWTLWTLWTDIFSTQWPVVSRPQHSAVASFQFPVSSYRFAVLTSQHSGVSIQPDQNPK